jgi:integrase
MARMVRDGSTGSRSGRLRLAPRREPYWTRLAKGCYLGYRKGAQGSGAWVARWRDAAGKQHFRALGAADDVLDADGVTSLSFDTAQTRARERLAAVPHGMSRRGGAYTVADCMADYLDWLRQHRKSARHIETYVNTYVLPSLGKIDTAKLTPAMIRYWHERIAAEPPRLRTLKGKAQRYRAEDPNPAEAQRKRRLRANRHLVTVRAALNRAWREGLIASSDAWIRVQQFRGVERQRTQFLTRDEARRLINTCPPDMRALVQAALLTGARYSELCALNVKDFHEDSGTLYIGESKSGRPRRVILNSEGVSFLKQSTAGHAPEAPLLRKADGSRWARDHHRRPFKDAVTRAGLAASFTFHELRHTCPTR